MEQFNLAEKTKLIVKDNVLAVISDKLLKTVSSAIFNGGCKQVKTVLNIGVPEGYSDLSLHLDPLKLITQSAAKLNITQEYLAMVTAAKIENYALVKEKRDEFSVSVAATAGCSHGESAGEDIKIGEIIGTINIIVFIDGNPTESCMVASLITATEAKSAVLRDFDMRSRYTGDSATGSITDSVTIVSTSKGKEIVLGGPASELGQLVGKCARKAVREALLKQEPIWAKRSVIDRLRERHLPVEKLATEISKVKGVSVTKEEITKIIALNPRAGAILLAAAKIDDDYKKNLLPTDYENWETITKCFMDSHEDYLQRSNNNEVDLPPFLKEALIVIVKQWLKR